MYAESFSEVAGKRKCIINAAHLGGNKIWLIVRNLIAPSVEQLTPESVRTGICEFWFSLSKDRNVMILKIGWLNINKCAVGTPNTTSDTTYSLKQLIIKHFLRPHRWLDIFYTSLQTAAIWASSIHVSVTTSVSEPPARYSITTNSSSPTRKLQNTHSSHGYIAE